MLKRLTTAFFAFVAIMGVSSVAFAEGATAGAASDPRGLIALAIGLGLGIAAAGGGVGQGKAASAALEGIGRNPGAAKEIFTPLLLSLALIESLVIYSLVISFMLLGKL